MCAKFQAKSLSESKSPGGGQTDRQTNGISCAARIFLRASLRTAVTQIGSSKTPLLSRMKNHFSSLNVQKISNFFSFFDNFLSICTVHNSTIEDRIDSN